jgi:Protein of unknown function (DUF2950)
MNYFPKSGLAGLALLALTIPALAAESPARFATPQDAFEAMNAALNTAGKVAILDVFGSDARDLLSTGNPQRDMRNRNRILDLITEGYRFQTGEDGRVTLLLGADAWPFPVPLARSGDTWAFDIEAGRDEVFFRRIGLNELDTIEMMSAYVLVQTAFRLVDHDNDGVMEFAANVMSSEDGRDGLFWAGEDSPLGARIALASLDGYNDGETDQDPKPFGGYYYRILQGQDKTAPGGAMDYMVGGNMVAGHALLAVPADYGVSGVQSFMVSENGVVLEADLGEDSLGIAFEMRVFSPGPEWTPVEQP